MNPLALLLILIAITGVVAVAVSVRRSRRQAMLRALASESKYNFSHADRFELAERLERAECGPGHVGGAPVRLARDVMYRTLGTSVDPRRHFVFVAELEPIAGERRIARLVCAVEEGGAEAALRVVEVRDDEDVESFRSLMSKPS